MNSVFNWICILILLLAIIIICVGQNARSAPRDSFVQAMEMQLQVHPGQSRVWPLCQCTVRYVGTTVKGRRYFIEVDRLD